MIKAVMDSPNGRVILLGLSAENVRRLKDSKPIMFEASEVGLSDRGLRIAIVYGHTEETIKQDIANAFHVAVKDLGVTH